MIVHNVLNNFITKQFTYELIRENSNLIENDFQWEADMDMEWVLVNPSDINKMFNIRETDEVELISMNQYKPNGFVMTVCRILPHENVPKRKLMLSNEEFSKFADCDLSNILLQDRNEFFMKHRSYTGELRRNIKQLLILTMIMECKREGGAVTVNDLQSRLFNFCTCKNDCLVSEIQDNELQLIFNYLIVNKLITVNHDDTINTEKIHVDLLDNISSELNYISCFANRF